MMENYRRVNVPQARRERLTRGVGQARLALSTPHIASRSFPIDADILRVPVGAGALHVERYGHGGEPVVLLHGFGTSSFLWRAVAPALALGGHTAFAVDLLGYGESDRPLDGDYSIAAQAEYVEQALAALRVVDATMVGIDIGGGVVQRLAVTHGARVARVVLINSVGCDECPGRDVRSVQRATARYSVRVSHGMLGAAPLLTRALEGSVARPDRMSARLVARYLAPYAGSDGVAHLLRLARALRAADVEGLKLGSIRVPALIVWGEEDRWLDSGLAERLQQLIPGSAVVRLPGVGRLVPEEAPAALNQILLEFIAWNPAPSTK
jgi:pimeloyl-ACP methyl ester carboxylesterase